MSRHQYTRLHYRSLKHKKYWVKNESEMTFRFGLFGFALVYVFLGNSEAFPVERRSAAPERSTDDYPDYLLGVKYDEYPMIVPKKRAALLIDRLMVALQKAIEEEEASARSMTRAKNYSIRSEDAMDLQRRHVSSSEKPKGRSNYWRCYFNAVTCF